MPQPPLDPPADYCEDGEHRYRVIRRDEAKDGTVFVTKVCQDCGKKVQGEE